MVEAQQVTPAADVPVMAVQTHVERPATVNPIYPSINNDDHYVRADQISAPMQQQPVPAISPFDHNPNPGSSLPEWRQFGFESELQYA